MSEIQKNWGDKIGETNSDFSLDVMDAAHNLLLAETAEGIKEVLNRLTITQYLGDVWVQGHPTVKEQIRNI